MKNTMKALTAGIAAVIASTAMISTASALSTSEASFCIYLNKAGTIQADKASTGTLTQETADDNAKLMFFNGAVIATDMELAGTPVPDGHYLVELDKLSDVFPTDPTAVDRALQSLLEEPMPGSYTVLVFNDGVIRAAVFSENAQVIKQIAELDEITSETIAPFAEKNIVGFYPTEKK